MKYPFLIFFLLAGRLCAQQPGANHIQVAILGTFHLGESDDYRQSEMDSPLSGKRQREVIEVVNKLAAFKPDKIFVENTPEAQGLWNEVFENYMKGRMPVDKSILVNEIFQFGVRTAALNPKSKGVICINYDHEDSRAESSVGWRRFEDEILNKKPSYDQLFEKHLLAKGVFDEYMASHKAWKSLSLKQHLLRMNEEPSLRALQYFNTMAWMDNNTNGLGAEFTTREYYRNLKIIQNLYKNLGYTDKRILIIYGAAHAKFFRDILESHPVFEVVHISQILK